MTNDFDLKTFFISNPSAAIEKSQQIICSVAGFNSYDDFSSYHIFNHRTSACQKELTSGKMSIHCFDCANNRESCVCLQCFLNGNHKDHDYIIRPDSIGSCACGDLSLWKNSGFCKEHQGEKEDSHPESYLNEKLRSILTDNIFKAAFSSLKELQKSENDKYQSIFEFLLSFLKFGDGFRRLLSISLLKNDDFESLFGQVFESSPEFNQHFHQLCIGLITDNFFKVNLAHIVYKIMNQQIIPKDLSISVSKININYTIWNSFWFHCFSPKPIKKNILNYNWDWVSFALDFSANMKEYFGLKGLIECHYKMPVYFKEIIENIPIASKVQPNEQTQKFFDELFTKVLNCGTKDGLKNGVNDTIIISSFIEEHDKSYYTAPFLFNSMFYDILFCFQSNKSIKFECLFDELKKFYDQKTIQKDDHQIKSFHNGASFSFSFPLFDSLLFLFRIDEISRTKIARFFSMEKYQDLRIQLGLVTLKKLIAYVCFYQSIVPNKNLSLSHFLPLLNNSSNSVLYGIPYFIPFLQLLIGLRCNDKNKEFNLKEFFAFEMAKKLGVFDDYKSENYADEDISDIQIQIIFSALYLPILLVVERTLFNFNGYNFIEEQVILALKKGISDLNELNKAYDPNAEQFSAIKQCFNKILQKVATIDRRSNKDGNNEGNDSSFYLKKGIEWKNISAINLLNNQKVILNNEISKHPNKLIKIQKFEPEEEFFFKSKTDEIDSSGLTIQLKELLFTPTILAIVYHTLRSKETGLPTVELNDHLAMNILVLISTFVKDDENSQSLFDESTVINYDSTLLDLISKLKEVIFKGDSSIENTILNSKSLSAFFKVKIGSNKFKPKSFIDILHEKGELGENALKSMPIDINNDGSNGQQTEAEKNLIKKKHANKLKESIINNYKKAIANYSLNDVDSCEEQSSADNSEDVCNICSTTKSDEILSYPIYIYRTKFPFIIDKPPLTKINPLNEYSVDDPRDDEPDDFDELDQKDDEEDEEEEEEASSSPNLQQMLSKLNELDDHEEDELQSQIYSIMFDPDLLNQESRHLKKQQRKVLEEEKQERLELKKSEEEKIMKLKDPETGKIEVERRCTAGNNFVIQFGICQHLVHPECVNKDAFKCPIDRSFKNSFLPALDILTKESLFKESANYDEVNADTLSDEVKESISLFVDNYASFFFNPHADVFIELVKSISGLIATYEIRLRSLPDCLDSKKTKFLSRNLFLTTWYAYRVCGKPQIGINIDSRLTVFQQFIKKLIEFDDIDQLSNNNETIKKIVSSTTNSIGKEKEILLFLRRVCLSDYFLLDKNVSNEDEKNKNFIDWDEILSISNLSKRYEIQLTSLSSNENEFEFKPFVFTKLPQEFLRFALNPYNFPIDQTSKYTLYNLLDYNSLINSYEDDVNIDEEKELIENQKNLHILSYDTEELNAHLLFKYSKRVFPSVYLFIGKHASKIIITNMGKIGILKPFYLDKYGCSDFGNKRGEALFLNEFRYERTMDVILSGDFSYFLPL